LSSHSGACQVMPVIIDLLDPIIISVPGGGARTMVPAFPGRRLYAIHGLRSPFSTPYSQYAWLPNSRCARFILTRLEAREGGEASCDLPAQFENNSTRRGAVSASPFAACGVAWGCRRLAVCGAGAKSLCLLIAGRKINAPSSQTHKDIYHMCVRCTEQSDRHAILHPLMGA
jgi:hypothetical protein